MSGARPKDSLPDKPPGTPKGTARASLLALALAAVSHHQHLQIRPLDVALAVIVPLACSHETMPPLLLNRPRARFGGRVSHSFI
ncbi:MAG TPA: hypothetical protein VEV61_10305 [Streptosporangiaceae bacterium]|nr:hypothetical protein [Streptosporangiaceae bacterium]